MQAILKSWLTREEIHGGHVEGVLYSVGSMTIQPVGPHALHLHALPFWNSPCAMQLMALAETVEPYDSPNEPYRSPENA